MTQFYKVCPLPLEVAAALRANVGIPVGVRIVLEITPTDLPVRGNASAWGEPEDTAHADVVNRRLSEGDLWAWCSVRVTCTDGDVEGHAYLGACQYEDTAEFIEHGYLEDLATAAYAEYRGNINRLRAKYAPKTTMDQLDLRVAAAALLYKEITGREQPMDRTAEDILAEIKHAVQCCDSITWAQPVTLTYIIKVTGHVDAPNPDPVVLFEQVGAQFLLSTKSNLSFHHFEIGSVDFDGVQYG